jgi:hypothetical protein
MNEEAPSALETGEKFGGVDNSLVGRSNSACSLPRKQWPSISSCRATVLHARDIIRSTKMAICSTAALRTSFDHLDRLVDALE